MFYIEKYFISGSWNCSLVTWSQCCWLQKELQDVFHHWTSASGLLGDGHWNMFWPQCRVSFIFYQNCSNITYSFCQVRYQPSPWPGSEGDDLDVWVGRSGLDPQQLLVLDTSGLLSSGRDLGGRPPLAGHRVGGLVRVWTCRGGDGDGEYCLM